MSQSTQYRVFAQFTEPTSSLSTDSSISLMSQTSPIISSALNHAFPIFLIFDNVLSFITWTNDDPYYNFLCITGIVTIVLNWHNFTLWFMPLMFAMVFCCVAWSVKSIMEETSVISIEYDEEEKDIPTIQEILDTLENLSSRFEILMSPLSCLRELNFKDISKLLILTVWVTPLQIFILKYVVKLDIAITIFTVFILTYHSPWAIATRRLLWRSVYIRRLTYAITGLNPLTSNDSYDQKSFKIISDKELSPGKSGKTIEFEILENQRRWIAIGWCNYLLPHERDNFTTISLSPCQSPQDFEFTTIHASHTWKWLENSWSIDHEFNKNNDGEGWIYYDTNWKYPSFYDGMTKYTRTRKWKRKAVLIIERPS